MSDTQNESTSYDLGRYTKVLRRRWWVVLVFALLGVLASAAYAATQPREVTATTMVSINLTTAANYNAQKPPSQLIDPVTEGQVARSASVLTAASQTLADAGYDFTIGEMRRATTAAVVSDTNLARISFAGATREEANAGADAVAASYLDFRGQQASDRIERITGQLERRREALQGRLQAINSVLTQAPSGSAREGAALSDRQVVNLQLSSLVSQLNGLDSIDTDGGSVLTDAADNAVSVAPHRGLLIQIGLLVGLILGLAAAFVVGSFDRRLRDPLAISKIGAGEVLATVSGTEGRFPPADGDLEAMRQVRERLLATLPGDAPVVAIGDLTSRTSDVGPNLAYALCESGRRVDLVLPGVDPAYLKALVAGFGLVDEGETNGVRCYGGGTLDVLVPTSGLLLAQGTLTPGERPSEGDRTDITIVSLPHDAARSQLLGAARLGGAAVLVMSRGKARKATVSDLVEELTSVGARVYGTVLTPDKRTLAAGSRPTASGSTGSAPTEAGEAGAPTDPTTTSARTRGEQKTKA